MNLIEAIKSGKEFKRSRHRDWFDSLDDDNFYDVIFLMNKKHGTSSENLSVEDILANDWEVKED